MLARLCSVIATGSNLMARGVLLFDESIYPLAFRRWKEYGS